MKRVVTAKLHGIHVTEAHLHYHGSITLDPEHCRLAGILPMEFVEIWNKNSGARISTYVIYGAPGSKVCVLNGAAARTCQVGDPLIVCASSYLRPHEITEIEPKILTFHPDNAIAHVLSYKAERNAAGWYDFHIFDEKHHELPIPLDEDLDLAQVG